MPVYPRLGLARRALHLQWIVIGVNVVAPGIIETDFTRQALSHPGAREFMSANIALGRVGVSNDIGGRGELPLLRSGPLGECPTRRSLRRNVPLSWNDAAEC